MPDDLRKIKEDRKLANPHEDYEVRDLKKHYPDITIEETKKYMEDYGPGRKEVEKRLDSLEKRRRNAR